MPDVLASVDFLENRQVTTRTMPLMLSAKGYHDASLVGRGGSDWSCRPWKGAVSAAHEPRPH